MAGKAQRQAKATERASGQNPASPIAWDGDTPVYVIDRADDGSALIGRFASVELSYASLSAKPPPESES